MHLALDLAAHLTLPAPEQLRGIRRHVALEHVGRVQLAEKLDHFVLRHCIVAKLAKRGVPDLLHRALPVHQPDDHVRRGREPVKALGGEVLEDVPELSAILVAKDLGVAAQARLEAGDAIPGRAE